MASSKHVTALPPVNTLPVATRSKFLPTRLPIVCSSIVNDGKVNIENEANPPIANIIFFLATPYAMQAAEADASN